MVKAAGMRSWNMNAGTLEASVHFYQELLGAEVGQRHRVGGVDVVRLKVGDSSIGLFDASGGPRPGVPHHTFEIDGPEDAEEAKQELEAKGFTVDGVRPHRVGGYSIYVCDPDGNRIELSKGQG